MQGRRLSSRPLVHGPRRPVTCAGPSCPALPGQAPRRHLALLPATIAMQRLEGGSRAIQRCKAIGHLAWIIHEWVSLARLAA